MLRLFLLVALLMGTGVGAAHAETIAVAQPAGTVALETEGPITATVRRVASGAAGKAIDRQLNGVYRIETDASGNVVAKVFWRTLEGGGASVAISPNASSVVPIDGSGTLQAGASIRVEGSTASLVRAANDLATQIASGEAEGDGDDGDEEENASNETEGDATRDSSALGGGAAGGGSQPFQNELGQLPEINVEPEPESTTTVVHDDVFGVTTIGCEPVFDEAANEIIITEAPTKNGEKAGACSPGVRTIEVKSSPIGCDYDIRLEDGVAYPELRRYYSSGGNTTYIDTTCQADESQAFLIEESAEGCRIFQDTSGGVVYQPTRMVFRGARNEVREAESCIKRESSQAWEIEYKTEDCSLRDDFVAGRSYIRQQATYVGDDGVRRTLGACEDSGDFYAHVRDTTVCEPFADFDGDKLYAQYKVRIDTPTGAQFRTGACQLEETALTDLQETQAGCESFHFDYDGYSHGATRVIRSDTGAEVRSCREAEIRYDHQKEAEGWVYDDANLQAFPTESVYIILPAPVGKKTIQPAIKREGALPAAYLFQNETQVDGSSTYQAGTCERFVETIITHNYERPDGTIYGHPAGQGTPKGPEWACSTQNDTSWPNVGSSKSDRSCTYTATTGGRNCGSTTTRSGFRTVRTGSYRGTHVVTRDDGQVIVDESATRSMTCASSSCDGTRTKSVGGCPSSVSGGTVNNWITGLGWDAQF